MSEVRTPIWQFKCCVEWCKTILITELVRPGASVCLLNAGVGLDIGKLLRAHVGAMTLIDKDSDIREARRRYKERRATVPATFCVYDERGLSGAADVIGEHQFDVVFCFDNWGAEWSSKRHADKCLDAVRRLLRPDGLFAGIVPDAAQLWSRAQKQLTETGTSTGLIKGDLFSLSFDAEFDTFESFGTQFSVMMEDGSSERQFLVESATFIRMCRAHALAFIDMPALLQMYEEHKRNHHASLSKCGVLSGKKKALTQVDLIGMFCAFIFVAEGEDGEVL